MTNGLSALQTSRIAPDCCNDETANRQQAEANEAKVTAEAAGEGKGRGCNAPEFLLLIGVQVADLHPTSVVLDDGRVSNPLPTDLGLDVLAPLPGEGGQEFPVTGLHACLARRTVIVLLVNQVDRRLGVAPQSPPFVVGQLTGLDPAGVILDHRISQYPSAVLPHRVLHFVPRAFENAVAVGVAVEERNPDGGRRQDCAVNRGLDGHGSADLVLALADVRPPFRKRLEFAVRIGSRHDHGVHTRENVGQISDLVFFLVVHSCHTDALGLGDGD